VTTMAVRRGWTRSLVAALLAMAIAVLGLVAPTAALAAPITSGGITFTVDYGDDSYGEHSVVEPGVAYTGDLSYDLTQVEPGSSVTITIPEGVELPSEVPSGNESISDVAV